MREFKEHLSMYLERAARGETIQVTDRGVPKVLISPVLGDGQLQRGIEEGWIRPALRTGLAPIGRFRSQRAIRDVLAEDRAEDGSG